MKYMLIETFRASKAIVYARFEQQGRMLPSGLRYLDSWLERDGNRCFQLMETENADLFESWTSHWSDLIDFEIVPVEPSPTNDQVVE